MAYWNHQTPYNVSKPVFKSHKIHSTVSVRVARTAISRDSAGKYTIPAGVFYSSIGGEDRPLARDYVTAAATTSQAYLEISHPELFKVGDVLYHQESTNSITIGGTWVAGETVSIQINNRFLSFAVTQTAAADVAAELAVFINASLFAQDLILRAEAVGAVVNLYTSGEATLVVTETSAAGTATAGAADFDTSYPLIGTISAIDFDNLRLTLSANSAIAVPSGAAVGPRVEYVYGVHGQPISLDDGRLVVNVGVYNEGDLYRAGLVYWDNLLKDQFPQLTVYYQT
jgi:hypothetical protein